MPSLQIRNLSEEVYQTLALRAEREHRSLAQQAAEDLASLPGLEARTVRQQTLERIAAEIGTERPLEPSPEALIREDRQR